VHLRLEHFAKLSLPAEFAESVLRLLHLVLLLVLQLKRVPDTHLIRSSLPGV
jgi:hypothetical protein